MFSRCALQHDAAGRRPILTSPWLRLIVGIGERLEHGSLGITLPDGRSRMFRGARPGPEGAIRLHSMRAIRRLVTGGGLGFAEAYLDGDWDSPSLGQTLELLAINGAAYEERYYGSLGPRLLARLAHLCHPNTRRGSRRNIHTHYDLGNRFYASWLDPTMTYSAARFETPEQPLEAAQRTKFVDLARRIGLASDHRLLEIGCGWGSFAEFAAREVGARVTAITISKEQHAYAAERIRSAGLNERIEVRLQDYRDLTGRFDRIVSIEMLEAVGERHWPVFFGKLQESLVPGGIAGLQVITIADRFFEAYRRGADFIQRHVFPGGMLPSPGALDAQFARAGLDKIDQQTFGPDYARTLAVWNRNFQRAWPKLRRDGFDDRFKPLWDYYLAYCEAGFRAGFIDVAQIALRRS